ncbi:hypothetical protein RDABS01_013575 [Bienertia sinuspersici]
MMLIDTTMAVQLHSSSSLAFGRSIWSSDDFVGVNVAVPWLIARVLEKQVKKIRGNFESCFNKRNELSKSRIQASGKYLGSGSDQIEENGKSKYHPFEDISDSEETEAAEGRLTASETSRTIIEVNSKATLMFSGMINDEVHENIFWPDLPYLTDEHGNTKEILSEMELSGPATIDFGIEEIEEDDSDFNEDDEEGDDDGDDDFEGVIGLIFLKLKRTMLILMDLWETGQN